MGNWKYRIYDDNYPYFMTTSVVWGIPIFADPLLAAVILDTLRFLQTDRDVNLYAYVIMHNHIHWVAMGDDLANKIQRMKSFSARRIIESLKGRKRTRWLRVLGAGKRSYKTQSDYQVWQEGYHPKQILSAEMMRQKMNYIHYNPVKAGFVDKPESWRYTSARNYVEGSGLIPITKYE
jgi:REP element-mobilizing transposase RayT